MNAKKSKLLRKIAQANGEELTPSVTTHVKYYHDVNGNLHSYRVVNPIKYPDGSTRSIYQDIKRIYKRTK